MFGSRMFEHSFFLSFNSEPSDDTTGFIIAAHLNIMVIILKLTI